MLKLAAFHLFHVLSRSVEMVVNFTAALCPDLYIVSAAAREKLPYFIHPTNSMRMFSSRLVCVEKKVSIRKLALCHLCMRTVMNESVRIK